MKKITLLFTALLSMSVFAQTTYIEDFESAILNILRKLCAEGKTIIVVHHDLQSAAEFFDWVILLNMRLVASGPIKEVFNPKLLQETYGGKLSLLSEISELIQKREIPSRETY